MRIAATFRTLTGKTLWKVGLGVTWILVLSDVVTYHLVF